MNRVRIFLLRILIGWWMIICAWLIVFPMLYLFTGKAGECAKEIFEFSGHVWNGET